MGTQTLLGVYTEQVLKQNHLISKRYPNVNTPTTPMTLTLLWQFLDSFSFFNKHKIIQM